MASSSSRNASISAFVSAPVAVPFGAPFAPAPPRLSFTSAFDGEASDGEAFNSDFLMQLLFLLFPQYHLLPFQPRSAAANRPPMPAAAIHMYSILI